VAHKLGQFQNYERDCSHGEKQETIGERHGRRLQEAAQSRVMLIPHVEPERKGDHEDESDVGTKRDLSLAEILSSLDG